MGNANINFLLKSFGQRLKQARLAARMTQPELAHAAKISQAFVSHVEIGRCQNLSVRILLLLAKVLKVTPAKLLGSPRQKKSTKLQPKQMPASITDRMPKSQPKKMDQARRSRAAYKASKRKSSS